MTQQTSPFIEAKYGWSFGESNWNGGMDENLTKFSYLFDRNVDGIVASLPAAVSGEAYFLTTDNRLYFAIGATWYSTSVPKWFQFYIRSTGDTYEFNGTTTAQINSPAQLDSRLDAAELTLSALGSAAFQDVAFFASQVYVDSRLVKSFDDFGAIGDGVVDDTAAIQDALDSGYKYIRALSGKTYNITSVTITGSDIEIFLEPGSRIAPQTPTAKAIIVLGSDCSLVGGGTIQGQPVFDGANVQPTYALVWVEGNNFKASGIVIDTIPKEGIMFENSTGGIVENCRIIGRYPYASYNEASTTNHCAILSNIPSAGINPEPTLTVVGNYFESCIQGILSLNYGAAGNNTGNTVTGNTFKNCWDHGVYMSRGKGHTIVGNTFLSCRRPIVSDGVGSTVVGNTLYSALTGVSNAEQMISVRESSNSVIANNNIYGVDAAIYVDCIETVVANGNIIQGNSLFSTGTVFANAMIRVGVGATTCQYNKIVGNTLTTTTLPASDALIQVTMLSGFGRGNEVSGNTAVRTNPGSGISINRNNFSVCRNNRVDISGSAGGATSITGILVDNSDFPVIKDNDLYYTSGGTNVSATGISTGAGCTLPKVHDNKINFTASLSSYTPTSFSVTTDAKRNLFDPNASMTGTFTWPTTTASFAVTNANVRTSSKIIATPLDQGAAVTIRDKGFYVTASTGSFTIFTAAGDTTVQASNWAFEIL